MGSKEAPHILNESGNGQVTELFHTWYVIKHTKVARTTHKNSGYGRM